MIKEFCFQIFFKYKFLKYRLLTLRWISFSPICHLSTFLKRKATQNSKENVKWLFQSLIIKSDFVYFTKNCPHERASALRYRERNEGREVCRKMYLERNGHERFCTKDFKNDWCARIQLGVCAACVEIQIHQADICSRSGREYSSHFRDGALSLRKTRGNQRPGVFWKRSRILNRETPAARDCSFSGWFHVVFGEEYVKEQ